MLHPAPTGQEQANDPVLGRQRESTPLEEEWQSRINDVGSLKWYTVAFQPFEGSVRGAWPWPACLGPGMHVSHYAHPGILGLV